ncbi:MAG TPA: cytochrome P450 [Pseudonocardia sp.]
MATVTASDLFTTGRGDPYPIYAELRERDGGVHFMEPVNSWVMLRYDDGQRLSRDRSQWSSDYFGAMGMGAHDPTQPTHRRYAQVMSRNLMMRDAPDHTRLRKLLNHAFTGKATRTWNMVIESVVDDVLGAARVDEEINLFTEIAELIPVTVVARLLGVPVQDRRFFRNLSLSFALSLDLAVTGDERDRVIEESVQLFDYVRDLAEDKKNQEADDLLTTLLRAEEDGGRLTLDEIIAQVCMLLVAGNETTADLITTGLALLLRHPDQFHDVRRDHSLIDPALLEVLRFEPPLQFSPRIAATDIHDAGGKTIPRGSNVFFCHGSANRDPRQFERPDEFDIRRGDKRHLAFAAGPHFCIGNQLALTEGAIFFRKLLTTYDRIELTAEPRLRTDRFNQRGYETVPITLTR